MSSPGACVLIWRTRVLTWRSRVLNWRMRPQLAYVSSPGEYVSASNRRASLSTNPSPSEVCAQNYAPAIQCSSPLKAWTETLVTPPPPPTRASELIPSRVCAQKIMRIPSRVQVHRDSDRGNRFQVHACKPVAIIFCHGAKQTKEGKVRTYYCKNESQKSVDDKLL